MIIDIETVIFQDLPRTGWKPWKASVRIDDVWENVKMNGKLGGGGGGEAA
jgi:hypothetical protein